MQICIIGGGVVGLNIALQLAEDKKFAGSEIFLLEQEKFLGHHTSTRNSEVIHAGFAYPPGSLKAMLCVEGNALSYELLAKLKVPFKKCGKWIIACGKDEESALAKALANGINSGAKGLEPVRVEKFYAAEPSAQNVTGAVFSAESGVMDAAGYIRALEVELTKFPNVNVIYPCQVTAIDKVSRTVETDRGPVQYDLLINAAGLWADEIHNMLCRNEDFQMCSLYQIVPFKGEYYTWRKGKIKTMIYPVPSGFVRKEGGGGREEGGGRRDEGRQDVRDATLVSHFGIHTHRNVAGELFIGPSQVKLSPDKKSDYSINTPPEEFASELSKFVKDVRPEDLEPAYAGNRPKLLKDGKPAGDFEIFKEGNVIHLMGMESPALTAAPAIARHVAKMI